MSKKNGKSSLRKVTCPECGGELHAIVEPVVYQHCKVQGVDEQGNIVFDKLQTNCGIKTQFAMTGASMDFWLSEKARIPGFYCKSCKSHWGYHERAEKMYTELLEKIDVKEAS